MIEIKFSHDTRELNLDPSTRFDRVRIGTSELVLIVFVAEQVSSQILNVAESLTSSLLRCIYSSVTLMEILVVLNSYLLSNLKLSIKIYHVTVQL